MYMHWRVEILLWEAARLREFCSKISTFKTPCFLWEGSEQKQTQCIVLIFKLGDKIHNWIGASSIFLLQKEEFSVAAITLICQLSCIFRKFMIFFTTMNWINVLLQVPCAAWEIVFSHESHLWCFWSIMNCIYVFLQNSCSWKRLFT